MYSNKSRQYLVLFMCWTINFYKVHSVRFLHGMKQIKESLTYKYKVIHHVYMGLFFSASQKVSRVKIEYIPRSTSPVGTLCTC